MVLTRTLSILFSFLFLVYLFLDLPISIHQFIYTKWFLNGLLATSGLIWLLREQNFFFPKLSKACWFFLSGLFLYKFIQIFTGHISPLSQTALDKVTFLILIGVAYNFYIKKAFQLQDVLVGIFVATFTFLVFILFDFLFVYDSILASSIQLAGNFGNINIAAEFIGLSLILQIAALIQIQMDKKLTVGLYILSALSTAYLYFASSRSVFLALAISICFLFCIRSVSKTKLMKSVGVICLAFTLCAGISVFQKSVSTSAASPITLDLNKTVSTHTRYQLILATLNLMRQHPLGVGAGEFEFAIMPYLHKMMPEYNEYVIPHAPHNEYLRFLVEEGVPYTLLLVCFVVLLLYDRRRYLVTLIQDLPILPAFFVYWAIQCAFQFPFTNGLSVLIICIFLSYALFVLYPASKHILRISFPFRVSVGFTSLFATFVACISISEYLTLTQPLSPEKSRIAYTLNSRNWYAGINHSISMINNGNLSKARKLLRTELKKRPHNFVALRELAYIELAEQNAHEACRLLTQYDSYFDNNSSFRSMRLNSCLGSIYPSQAADVSEGVLPSTLVLTSQKHPKADYK